METNENGDPLPTCYFVTLYDPTLHDGEIEGPRPVWCHPDGSIEHAGDENETAIMNNDGTVSDPRPPDFYSLYLHCRAGGCDCVCDTKTKAQALTYLELFKAAVTYRKGFL